MSEQPPVNIAAHVPARAREMPDGRAILWPRSCVTDPISYYSLSFAQLDQASDRIAHGLRSIGIVRGTRTVLMVPPTFDFYVLTFALFKAGAIVVLIDPGMGVLNLKACLKEAEPEAFIGITKAHLARLFLGWGRDTIRICVTVGMRLGWGGWTMIQLSKRGSDRAPVLEAVAASDTAAILFTSGSTGVAKGVVVTHGIFAAQVQLLQRTYDITPGEIDLPTFPLFGLFDPALGMTAVLPRMDPTRPAQVDPREILSAIVNFDVTNLFGSPALIRRVGGYGEAHGVRLPTLRRVISAGAPVPAAAIASFCTMLNRGVQVHTPYGATEALPVSSTGSESILAATAARTAQGAGVCVGRPVEGMQVRIIRISDVPISTWSDDLLLPRGQIGEVVVQGPVVTQSYYNRPEATALAKIAEASGRVCHRMGDLGYLDEKGRLWFCGRKTHRVETRAGPLYTIPCEGVFNAHPAVFRTALVGVVRSGETIPVLCVEREPSVREPDNETLQSELLALGARFEHTRAITTILFHRGFPVDIRHNAKIFREKLAVWADGRVP